MSDLKIILKKIRKYRKRLCELSSINKKFTLEKLSILYAKLLEFKSIKLAYVMDIFGILKLKIGVIDVILYEKSIAPIEFNNNMYMAVNKSFNNYNSKKLVFYLTSNIDYNSAPFNNLNKNIAQVKLTHVIFKYDINNNRLPKKIKVYTIFYKSADQILHNITLGCDKFIMNNRGEILTNKIGLLSLNHGTNYICAYDNMYNIKKEIYKSELRGIKTCFTLTYSLKHIRRYKKICKDSIHEYANNFPHSSLNHLKHCVIVYDLICMLIKNIDNILDYFYINKNVKLYLTEFDNITLLCPELIKKYIKYTPEKKNHYKLKILEICHYINKIVNNKAKILSKINNSDFLCKKSFILKPINLFPELTTIYYFCKNTLKTKYLFKYVAYYYIENMF